MRYRLSIAWEDDVIEADSEAEAKRKLVEMILSDIEKDPSGDNFIDAMEMEEDS
jgi:hypothetical protein